MKIDLRQGGSILVPNSSLDEAAVRANLCAALQGRDAGWLVESEAYLWDERGHLRTALDAGWKQAESAEFNMARVAKFQR